MTEWSIHEVARRSGVTPRALRHYDAVGILSPTRTGANGYRYYGPDALVRLQRILLLRDLGIGLVEIAQILDEQRDPATALRTHVAWLRNEQDRISRQIAAVQSTITAWEGGEKTMTENMFDGFDHAQYKEEVEQRWGADAYDRSDAWWREMTEIERARWRADSERLIADWIAAAERGVAPASAEAAALARRHVAWLQSVPGTPAGDGGHGAWAYVSGLAEMYPADPRFAATYATSAGGARGARFVRDALLAYVSHAQHA